MVSVARYIGGFLLMILSWIFMAILLALLGLETLFKNHLDIAMSFYFAITGFGGVLVGTLTTRPESRSVSNWLFFAISCLIYLACFPGTLMSRGYGLIIDPIDISFAAGAFICAAAFTIKRYRETLAS